MEYEHRVELAVHTGFSKGEGIGKPEEYLTYGKSLGMEAIAFTDVGNVSAFPSIYNFCVRKGGIFEIYGMDALVVDDREQVYEDPEQFISAPAVHASILLQNETGRRNLYRLISEAEMHHGEGNDITAKLSLRELLENREGMLIGSGRANGLLQPLVAKNMEAAKTLPEVLAVFDFLDYVEIQCDCDEALSRTLLSLADEKGIPAVAESAPFAMDPLDNLARDILLYNAKGERAPAPSYFLDTEAMLACFAYLGEEDARRIVIENPNKLARSCFLEGPYGEEELSVSREEDMDELRKLCAKLLPEKYPEVTEEIEDRLWFELDAISCTASAYMFLNIYRMKEKYQLHSYEFGSRGTVGCSLVAYLLGITEIDPIKHKLSPYFMFSIDGTIKPDIDLNLRMETRELFFEKYGELPGLGRTLWTDTVSFITDHMANAYLEKYEQETHVGFDEVNGEYLTHRLTTSIGQRTRHPVGILLIPEDVDIYDITPLRKLSADIQPSMSTVFDCYSLNHILTKVDFLEQRSIGPIYQLAQLTGTNPSDIRLDDPEVMQMFMVPETGYPACYGLPEFQTDVSMDILRTLQPDCFGDLVKMLGLMHGTNTWLGNAELLIKSGTCTIKDVIADRDDVFDRLIAAGYDKERAFMITGEIYKGKVARGLSRSWQKWRPELSEHGLPEWFITSCEKILYLFPKSQAISYMMMTWRLAWYKLHYRDAFEKIMNEESKK